MTEHDRLVLVVWVAQVAAACWCHVKEYRTRDRSWTFAAVLFVLSAAATPLLGGAS